MGIIKNIKLNEIEESLEKIVGLSFQARFFQKQYDVVKNQIKNNKSSFSSGNISKDVYNKNKSLLERERKKLIKKINKTIKKIQKVNESVQKVIKKYKI